MPKLISFTFVDLNCYEETSPREFVNVSYGYVQNYTIQDYIGLNRTIQSNTGPHSTIQDHNTVQYRTIHTNVGL